MSSGPEDSDDEEYRSGSPALSSGDGRCEGAEGGSSSDIESGSDQGSRRQGGSGDPMEGVPGQAHALPLGGTAPGGTT